MCLFTVLLSVCLGTTAYAQHSPPAPADHAHHLKGSHRLTLGLGHTHLSQGEVEGETKWLAAASWSLNYDYWLSDHWAIGLQNDIVLQDFSIDHGDNQVLERSYPWSIVPAGIYKPIKNWSFIGGVGAEYAHEQTLALTRLGVEYGVHLPHDWEVGGTAVWDNKWDYYNSWGLALTISKIWPRANKHD